MSKEKGKTAGQHLDAALARTKKGLHHSKEFVKKHASKVALGRKSKEGKAKTDTGEAKPKTRYILGAATLVLLTLLLILLWPRSSCEKATTEQAQEIARMLRENEVPIRGIKVDGRGYEITYAAEDAVGRFDDAILYDWAMIYGTAAAHDCDEVTIVTTLLDKPMHEQSVSCEAVRAFVRGVLTEEEFWLLVEHENLS